MANLQLRIGLITAKEVSSASSLAHQFVGNHLDHDYLILLDDGPPSFHTRCTGTSGHIDLTNEDALVCMPSIIADASYPTFQLRRPIFMHATSDVLITQAVSMHDFAIQIVQNPAMPHSSLVILVKHFVSALYLLGIIAR